MDGDLPAVFGHVTESKTVRTSAGGYGRDWFTRDGTASELSRQCFFSQQNKCVRKFHETRAECLRELRTGFIYYINIYDYMCV